MSNHTSIYNKLKTFAEAVTSKISQVTPGEPEDQLRGPFENFIDGVATSFGWDIVCKGETPLSDSQGKPDYAVHLNNILVGYVELKATGVGTTHTRFKGHNRAQFKRFSAIPNILYLDGNEWALYRAGDRVGNVIHFSGDVTTDGKLAVNDNDARVLERLLREYLTWEPIIPTDRMGKIDLMRFAEILAPLCRMLRDEVTDAIKDDDSPLSQVKENWKKLLFPDASDEQFADAYAQTVIFALLLGRTEVADPLTVGNAEDSLATEHNLLSRALQVLTDQAVQSTMSTSLDLLLRVIGAVPPSTFAGPENPWIYFYEDFLAAYDPKLRQEAGAYYTPVEVVHCQVNLINHLLVNRLSKSLGFADPSVVTLDPAVGTGTYLLGVIENALNCIETKHGVGAVPGQATALAKNLYGFEIMVGPYSVSELRVSRALLDRGAKLPKNGTNIYLTDTLESPNAEPPQIVMGFAQKVFAEQHKHATQVKATVPVIVCLGNPPYKRHDAKDSENEDNR